MVLIGTQAPRGTTKEGTMGETTTTDKTTSTPAVWLGQFIYLDNETFVHLGRSKEDAFQALADNAQLPVEEGQSVADLVDDRFGGSDLVSYNVLPVDSTDLDGHEGPAWLAQLIRWDGGTFVHVCRSEDDAYRAIVDQEDLVVGEGQTAKQVVKDELADSGEVIYVVAPADSTDL